MSTFMRSISRPTSSARKRLSLDRNSFSLCASQNCLCFHCLCTARARRAAQTDSGPRMGNSFWRRVRVCKTRYRLLRLQLRPQPRSQQLYHNDGRKRFCSRQGRFYSRELRFRRVLHTFRRFSLLRISRLDSVGVPLWARGVAWWT
jgi:hypothetical protein